MLNFEEDVAIVYFKDVVSLGMRGEAVMSQSLLLWMTREEVHVTMPGTPFAHSLSRDQEGLEFQPQHIWRR